MKNKTTEPRKPRPRPYPVVIEQYGKHYTSRYLANNEAERMKIGLEIIKDWKEAGYLHKDTSVPKTFELFVEKETNGMTVAEIEKMTKGTTAKVKVQFGSYGPVSTPQEQLDALKRRYQDYSQYNKAIEVALEALKTKDGIKAWQVINYFGDGEYMQVKTQTFDNVKY